MLLSEKTAEMQTSRRILVVEDTPICREPIISALRLKGFDAVGAGDGRKALELIAAVKPDLVLLDIVMPQMNGWEMLRELRGNPKTATMPVILLTATADRQWIARARAMGVSGYLLKGQFSMTELFTRVEKCFAPARNVAHSRAAAPPAPPTAGAASAPMLHESQDARRESEAEILAQAVALATTLEGTIGSFVDLMKKHPDLAAKAIQSADSTISHTGKDQPNGNCNQVVRSIALKAVRNIATCAA
jgi:CheY-like chemotaxis protein